MEMNMPKMLHLCITGNILLLRMQFLMQQGNQFGLNLCQLGEFFSSQFMQCFRMALQNNDDPSDYFYWIGVFDQPEFSFKDRRARRDSFLTRVGFTRPAFHVRISLMFMTSLRQQMVNVV